MFQLVVDYKLLFKSYFLGFFAIEYFENDFAFFVRMSGVCAEEKSAAFLLRTLGVLKRASFRAR